MMQPQQQQQQQQQLGYGQAEHARMLTAIRQPLFIQTPLQVMLETLVEKLQLQADVIGSLQDSVEGLERNKLSGSELLSRIQLLEHRVDAATAVSTCTAAPSATDAANGSPGGSSSNSSGASGGAPCSTASTGAAAAPVGVAASGSPFAQAKLVQQVASLEQQTTALLASSAQLAFRTEQVILPRLQECENRLVGVTNLAGALMAVDAMAAEIGIGVPHPPLSALTAIQGGGLGRDSQRQQQQQQQHQHVQSAPQQRSGNVLTLSRQQLVQQQIDDGRQQAAVMQQHLQHLQEQVDKLSSDAVAGQDQQLGVLAGLQDGVSGLSDSLSQQVALLRREFKPALLATELHTTSAAEFTKVQRQVEGLEGRHALLAKELAAFKAKEVAELSSNVAQLSRRVARITGAPGSALTETERALAAAQAELRSELVNLSARLAARDAADAVAAHQQDGSQGTQLDSGLPASAGRSRASQDSSSSMHATINRAVALALQAHMGVLSGAASDGSAASRSRCLVSDRALRDGSPPRCCTAPQAQQQQQQQSLSEQLLPLFDHFRPATAAAAAGASSCYSPRHTAAAADAGGGGGCSARHSSPGRSAGAVGSSGAAFGPKGPGLQAAQLRQMSAHRAGRLAPGSSSSSSSSATAAAAAAAGDCGIAGLMPVGGCAGELRGPGADGLIVSDLVSSNLRVRSAFKAAAAAAAAAAVPTEGAAAGAEASLIGAGLPLEGGVGRQQEQQSAGFRGTAMSPTSRPQTAAAVGSSEGRPGGPSMTVPAASRPTSSRAAASSKRNPLFL